MSRLATLFLLLPVLAQVVSIPDTHEGRLATGFVQALNGSDEAAHRAYLAASYAASALSENPVDARLARQRQMAVRFGKLTPVRFAAAPSGFTLVVKAEKANEFLELSFELEKAAPRKIVGLRVEASEGPPEPADPNPPTNQAQLVERLDALLAERTKADAFAGSVLLTKDGTPVFQKAYGLAERRFGAPNRVDTKFNLGSINKIFTKVAIAKLAEQGKLALTDRLSKHLPDYPKAVADRVTIEQLLKHTSGMGDFFGPKFEETAKDRFRKLSDFLPTFVDQPLKFEPGTRNAYSNAGYIVLGLVIEKLSGKSYDDFVSEVVFKPAGMADTAAHEADAPVANLAMGYTRGEDGRGPRRENVYTRPAKGSSAGGGYSTAPDLLKFAKALTSGKLLSLDYTRWILGGEAPKPGAAAPTGPLRGGLGIAGGSPGVNGVVEIDTDPVYTLIVLANDDPPAAESVARKVREWMKALR